MNIEVLGTDEFQAWFLDLSAEEQASVVNVVRKLEIAGIALGRLIGFRRLLRITG